MADGPPPTGPVPVVPGEVVVLSPLVRRLTAPNPGVMTGPGTNSYLVGHHEIVVVDPGPADDAHLDRLAAAGGGRIRWIVATHTHVDHAPGVAGLKDRTGAEVLAYDARDGLVIDRPVADGEVLATSELELEVVHTPGHASNHLCFELRDEAMLFSGDHIMQGSTVVITPPDGDMAAYLDSLRRLRTRSLSAIAPGHGHLIDDPEAIIDHYIAHRLAREEAIAVALRRRGTATVDELVADVYTDVAAVLHPIARFSVHAHLLKLEAGGVASGGPGIDDRWTAA